MSAPSATTKGNSSSDDHRRRPLRRPPPGLSTWAAHHRRGRQLLREEHAWRAIGWPPRSAVRGADALYWKPGWAAPPEEEFRAKLFEATANDGWVVAGGYHRETSATIWPRAETVVWLDLPLKLTVWRILRRSWTRWRRHELLWGTNEEKFWQQLKIWSREDSLIAFTVGTRHERHRRYLGAMSDPQWSHIRFIRLRSRAEVELLAGGLEAVLARGPHG